MRFELPRPWRNPHLQTIWAAKLSQRPAVAWRHELWQTPDGDVVTASWAGAPVPDTRPLLVLFHGLEGSAHSHYAQGLAAEALARGWDCVLPHFRGCGGAMNHAPRAYHSGDYAEIDWMLQQAAQRYPSQPLLAVGISLGGNALLLWAGTLGPAAVGRVRAVVSVCSPLDLMASGAALERGVCRWIYTPMFLQTMRYKALTKHRQFPGLFDLQRAQRATTLREFDDAFTAPVHGFAGVDDYWTRASAKPVMHQIVLPALALNASDDPFVPANSLPTPAEVGPRVVLVRTHHGGHVGYPSWDSGWRGHVRWMPQSVCGWLAPHAMPEPAHG
jgi:uncharacterized protein